jgi:RNA polymerase sigma factor (sigma-70 family)
MAIGQWGLVVREMQSLFGAGTARGASSGQWLDRFVRHGEDVAFEAILAMHGPMVLGVCRRVLRDPRDVEDAFQATFLILVRKAATIGDGDLLESWLYKVATRVALRARAEAGRRRDREQIAVAVAVASAKALDETVAAPSALNHDELRLVLDEEIGRLPEKYRAPLVLFHLRGLSQAETARCLGCPAGTVGSRLARARERLRRRLVRRGFAPSIALLVTLLNREGAEASTSASMPSALATTTAEAALSTATGSAAASAPVAALVGHVVRSMGWNTALITIGALGAFGAVLAGAAALSRPLPATGADAEVLVAQKERAPAAPDLDLTLAPPADPRLLTFQNPAPAVAAPKEDDALIDDKTEQAIKTGLTWLANVQHDNGSYGMGTFKGGIASTSLAAMAFMAGGSGPSRGPHGDQVEKALQYVLDRSLPSGFLNAHTAATHGPMYDHAFGTLFLSEAYDLTRRPEIRDKLAKAVRLIVDSQNDEGGWRYQPVRGDADLSVTVCQLNALRGARQVGLFVPPMTFEKSIGYAKKSQNPDGGFRYMLQGGASAFPRSAGGVLALSYEQKPDAPAINRGIAYMMEFKPEKENRFSHYFYGHYYAAQAMRQRGGNAWKAWYKAIRDDLLARQSRQGGSWSDTVGTDYGTAMALIILQAPKNYLLMFRDR